MANCANGHVADDAAKYCAECGAEVTRRMKVPPPPRSFEPLPVFPATGSAEPTSSPPTLSDSPFAESLPSGEAASLVRLPGDPRGSSDGRSTKLLKAGVGVFILLVAAAAVLVVVQREHQAFSDFERIVSSIEVMDSRTESMRDLAAIEENVFFANWTLDDDYDEFNRLAKDWHQRVSTLASDYSTWAAPQIARLSNQVLEDDDADGVRDLAIVHYQAWLEWSRQFPDVIAAWALSDTPVENWKDFAAREAGAIRSRIGRSYQMLCSALRGMNTDNRVDRRIESICRS
jgi:hypothetical protein